MKKIYKIALMAAAVLFLGLFLVFKNMSGTTTELVLTTDVHSGQVITDKMLTTKVIKNGDKPSGIVNSKSEIVGKSLSTPRLKDDYIPKSIVKSPSIKLKDGEAIITLTVPKSEAQLINENTEISLALLDGSTNEPEVVSNIYIIGIQDIASNNGSDPSQLVIAKTTTEIATKAAPYIANNKFKIFILPEGSTISAVGSKPANTNSNTTTSNSDTTSTNNGQSSTNK